MVKNKKQSRREKSRSRQRSSGLSGGAGLMKFFEDSGLGPKINPMTVVVLATFLITLVILGHLGVYEWLI